MAKAHSAFYEHSGPVAHGDIPFIVLTENPDPDCKDLLVYNLHVTLPDGRVLLKDVSLHFRPGDKVIVTGESGSGKTTTVKAVMGDWDYGRGLVVMPKGARTMLFSQQAYTPNANLRTILNMMIEGKEKFTDRELRKALQDVGLGQLVQQIPGQQVEVLIDTVVDEVSALIVRDGPVDENGLFAMLSDSVSRHVPGMFSTVQYIPESQRVYLRERLAEMLETCGCSEDTARTEMFSEKLADHIDSALAAPLEQKLGMFVANLASRKSGRVYSYTPAKVDYFCRTLERSLEKRFGKYLDNDDTDDAFREIRLNRQQVRNLTEGAVVRMRHEMTQYAKSGPLHQVFNAASWPISLQALRVKASSAADEIIQATTFFMDRQVVTGDTLKLSGGEKQKLMMAVARLHKPDILFLDEITAALDRETGKRQYQELMDSLPKQTIVVSIAHNLHIMPSHNLHVHLKDQGVTVRRVDPAGLNPGPKPGV